MAPAAPGGGWDQTARSMQQALIAEKLVKSVQVINVTGAGGTVGLAQLVNGAKGDGNQLMVNGFVMVGALLMNKSPVTLEQVTPIARLTEETQVIVVPANSPIKNAKDLADAGEEERRQGDMGRRLGRRRRSDHRGVVRQRGRRRRLEGQLHRRSPAAASRSPQSSAARSPPAFPAGANTKARSRPASCAPSA